VTPEAPREIRAAWEDLLSNRALLYETFKQFKGPNDFERRLLSQNLADRKDVAALEHFAESCFNLVADLAKEFLCVQHPDQRSELKRLNTDEVLKALRHERSIANSQWEMLDELREGRNALQHGSSVVPWRQVWSIVERTQTSIDRIMPRLQRAFTSHNIELDMDLPEYETGTADPSADR